MQVGATALCCQSDASKKNQSSLFGSTGLFCVNFITLPITQNPHDKSMHRNFVYRWLNGDEGSRTPDLLNAIQARSQLRHAPMLSHKREKMLFSKCQLCGGTLLSGCQSYGGYFGGCLPTSSFSQLRHAPMHDACSFRRVLYHRFIACASIYSFMASLITWV